MPSEQTEILHSIQKWIVVLTLTFALTLIVIADIGYFVSDGNEHFFLFASIGILGGIIAVSSVGELLGWF